MQRWWPRASPASSQGTTGWQLKLNGTVVRSGAATASSGCPTRGTWQVALGALTAGNYTIGEARGAHAERRGRRRDVKAAHCEVGAGAHRDVTASDRQHFAPRVLPVPRWRSAGRWV